LAQQKIAEAEQARAAYARWYSQLSPAEQAQEDLNDTLRDIEFDLSNIEMALMQ